MLIRLKVNGFKNLLGVDVRFGPFTCIAGANGVGKSNLFDAIHFLSVLANRPLIEAGLAVRGEGGGSSDLRDLFHRRGMHHAKKISFEAEMIVPAEAVDDLGQVGKASITILKYSLELGYKREKNHSTPMDSLEILKEELVHIRKGEANQHIFFPHSRNKWRDTVVKGARRVPYFISTEGHGDARVIKLHQDGGSSGGPLARLAASLPRTVLSVANAAESPTVLCARREMESWQILQLEPSALSRPDEMNARPRIASNGAHLPANLYHLAQTPVIMEENKEPAINPDFIFNKVTNRLHTLVNGLEKIWVGRDEKREILTLQATFDDGTDLQARSLPGGALRFLALSVIELDKTTQGLICLEEPENGIHPERIPAILQLLRIIATDPYKPVDETNPLRQVIVNTHSPSVVSEVAFDSLLFAEIKNELRDGLRFKKVSFTCLSDTWRTKALEKPDLVSRSELFAYVHPSSSQHKTTQRIINETDRDDLQMAFPWDRTT